MTIPIAVFDCMVYLQAAGRDDGPGRACLALVQARRLLLAISPTIRAELQDVLNRPKIHRRFPSLTPESVLRAFAASFQEKVSDSRMDDKTWYNAYYAGTNIPKDIPIRVRNWAVETFGTKWENIKPDDRPFEDPEDLWAWYELDYVELLGELVEGFGISISLEVAVQIDTSFDDVVQYIARRRAART